MQTHDAVRSNYLDVDFRITLCNKLLRNNLDVDFRITLCSKSLNNKECNLS